MPEHTRSSPTNTEVAARIGLDHSTVSRIRRGERNPSVQTMVAVAREYGWGVDSQAQSMVKNQYGEDFEAVLCRPEQ